MNLESATIAADPTPEIKSKFKEISGSLVGAMTKEMKYEQLV